MCIAAFLRNSVLHKEFFNAGPQSETLNKEDIDTKETTEIYRITYELINNAVFHKDIATYVRMCIQLLR